jgi:hypothetical protein
MRLTIRIQEYTQPGRRGANINRVEDFEMDGTQVMKEVAKDFIEVTDVNAQETARAAVDYIGANQYMVVRWVNRHGSNIISLATYKEEDNETE